MASIGTDDQNVTDFSYLIHNQKIDVYNDAAAYMYDYAWVSIKGQRGLNPPIPKEGKVEVPGIQYTWDETYDGLIDIMEIVLASRLAMKTELDINTDIFEEYPYIISYQLNNEKEDGEAVGINTAKYQIEPTLPLVEIKDDYHGVVTLIVDFAGAIIKYKIGDNGEVHTYSGPFNVNDGDKVIAWMEVIFEGVVFKGDENSRTITVGVIADLTSYTTTASAKYSSTQNRLQVLGKGFRGESGDNYGFYYSKSPYIKFSTYIIDPIFEPPYDSLHAAIAYSFDNEHYKELISWTSSYDKESDMLQMVEHTGDDYWSMINHIPDTVYYSWGLVERTGRHLIDYAQDGGTYIIDNKLVTYTGDVYSAYSISYVDTFTWNEDSSPIVGYISPLPIKGTYYTDSPVYPYDIPISHTGYLYSLTAWPFCNQVLSYGLSYLYTTNYRSMVEDVLPEFKPYIQTGDGVITYNNLTQYDYTNGDSYCAVLPITQNMINAGYLRCSAAPDYYVDGQGYEHLKPGWTLYEGNSYQGGQDASYTIPASYFTDNRARIIYIPVTYYYFQ